jgi:predicted nucleotidyltransferase
LESLAEHGDQLRSLGVRRLALFGSAARDEITPASDLDFLVEFEIKSFDRYMDLKFLLEDWFGRRVDLVLPESIKPRLREHILRDAVDAEGF